MEKDGVKNCQLDPGEGAAPTAGPQTGPVGSNVSLLLLLLHSCGWQLQIARILAAHHHASAVPGNGPSRCPEPAAVPTLPPAGSARLVTRR